MTKTKTSFYKSVLLLAIPIALQNLLTALLNIFDQMMVGWLPGGIADNALSAVLLANQIVFIFQIICFAVSNTVNIFIVQYTENGKHDLIKNRAFFTFIVLTIVSLLATALCFFAPDAVIGLFNPSESYRQMAADFLRLASLSFLPMGLSTGITFMSRAIKKMTAPLIVNVCAVGLNVLLNYTFMFGLFGIAPMGFLGAAYGTIFSRLTEFIALAIVLVALKSPLVGKPSEVAKLDGAFVKQYFKMFVPVLCNEIFWVLSSTVLLFVYDKLPDSETVLASVNIAQSLDKIVSVIMIGVGNASGIVLGNVIGRGDREEVLASAKKVLLFALLSGLTIAVLTFACAFIAPSIFTGVSAATKKMSRNLIMLYALTAPFRMFSFAYCISIMRTGGDTTFCMVSETLIIWVIVMPLVLLFGLVLHANLYVVYLVYNIAELLKIAVWSIRVKRHKWLKFELSPVGENENERTTSN